MTSSSTDRKPAFWKSEDWLAVGLGAVVIASVLLGFPTGVPKFGWSNVDELRGNVFAPRNLECIATTALLVAVLASAGVVLMGGRLARYLIGLPLVYLLALLALLIAGNVGVRAWGLEYVIFALLIGLFVSNVLGLPRWLEEAVRTEFYIKTGLVILGTSILFTELLGAGVLGIVQALIVVIPVWFFSFWLGRRLGVDDEFSAMLSTAVSICGVSAAIAACGAIQGDRRKLSYITSLVLIVAVPMMVVMPWIIRSAEIPEMVGGAWLGGTLDTSGSVVAAGALIGEMAMKVGVVVKFSQNVLLGVAALLLSLWWTLKTEGVKQRPGFGVIWERFPKFVLGFLAASLFFSFALHPDAVTTVKPTLEGIRNIWFALAFTCIGLETRFASLLTMEGGRPALTFIGAQVFNVFWTLLIAFLLFGGLLFQTPTFK